MDKKPLYSNSTIVQNAYESSGKSSAKESSSYSSGMYSKLSPKKSGSKKWVLPLAVGAAGIAYSISQIQGMDETMIETLKHTGGIDRVTSAEYRQIMEAASDNMQTDGSDPGLLDKVQNELAGTKVSVAEKSVLAKVGEAASIMNSDPEEAHRIIEAERQAHPYIFQANPEYNLVDPIFTQEMVEKVRAAGAGGLVGLAGASAAAGAYAESRTKHKNPL
ncbi:MAG: hypothetical protein JW727_01725 [Candidatus Aenigmarchaeota archaeon]|nr:hypothetical protein [Candidatus Aenigmarchaeota archaeon]